MRYLVHHLLEASAEARPDAIAVADGGRSVAYRELDEQANALAGLLVESGVRPGERVALYLDKSIESVVAIYGILKAGAAYVPLDPQAPIARLAYILRDAAVTVLVSGVEKSAAWSGLQSEGAPVETLVVLNGAGPIEAPAALRLVTTDELATRRRTRTDVSPIEDDLAYILYTSGSTGVPKGVMLSHRNCLAFVEWAAEEFAVSSDDRLSSHAPLHFDLSTLDLFAAALAGATVVLVPPQASVFPSEVRRFIEENEITVWYSVPSVLTMLSLRGGLGPGDCPRLRTVLFAGEVFPTKHLRRLMNQLPHVRFANLFGPTETNVCTWWEVPPLPEDMTEAIPIGRAIANVEVFAVTDEGLRAAPGEVGELCVRGATVMQGYLGDPEKSRSRLVPNPLDDLLAQPVYRTGDLVVEQDDGVLRFLGRRDSQVKSRGYRIELGDVETAISAHDAVEECAVVAIPDELVTNRLTAFVVTLGDVSAIELASFCAARVPEHMIPESFQLRRELPRTSTGKIDRRSLAEDATRERTTPVAVAEG
jgi:amino acid adenylation domain-containing protein